jgi:hypothetical protein
MNKTAALQIAAPAVILPVAACVLGCLVYGEADWRSVERAGIEL